MIDFNDYPTEKKKKKEGLKKIKLLKVTGQVKQKPLQVQH